MININENINVGDILICCQDNFYYNNNKALTKNKKYKIVAIRKITINQKYPMIGVIDDQGFLQFWNYSYFNSLRREKINKLLNHKNL